MLWKVVVGKLDKMFMLLESSNDGEVIAAVRAIRRTVAKRDPKPGAWSRFVQSLRLPTEESKPNPKAGFTGFGYTTTDSYAYGFNYDDIFTRMKQAAERSQAERDANRAQWAYQWAYQWAERDPGNRAYNWAQQDLGNSDKGARQATRDGQRIPIEQEREEFRSYCTREDHSDSYVSADGRRYHATLVDFGVGEEFFRELYRLRQMKFDREMEQDLKEHQKAEGWTNGE